MAKRQARAQKRTQADALMDDLAIGEERFREEDGYTNKSGDPRIGTHRRTYEAGERETKEVR